MVAISRSRTKIWIQNVDTAASTLVSSAVYSTSQTSGYLAGEIKSYSKSGGEDDVESDAVFGGYVDKEKPTSQFEISFEIVPDVDDDASGKFVWEKLVYGEDGSNAGVYTTASAAANRAIFIQATDGTAYKSWAFNNCNAVSLDMEHNADDNQTVTLNFKFSPTDADGVPNFMYKAAAITTLPAWTALDTE